MAYSIAGFRAPRRTRARLAQPFPPTRQPSYVHQGHTVNCRQRRLGRGCWSQTWGIWLTACPVSSASGSVITTGSKALMSLPHCCNACNTGSANNCWLYRIARLCASSRSPALHKASISASKAALRADSRSIALRSMSSRHCCLASFCCCSASLSFAGWVQPATVSNADSARQVKILFCITSR